MFRTLTANVVNEKSCGANSMGASLVKEIRKDSLLGRHGPVQPAQILRRRSSLLEGHTHQQ